MSILFDINHYISGAFMLPKSSPKAPAAPDPAATASAQTASNKETAYWNAVLNNTNQVTPYGNLTFTQNPSAPTYDTAYQQKAEQEFANNGYWTNGRGEKVSNAPIQANFQNEAAPPSFTSTINLSPEQQKIYDTQTSQQQRLLDIGGQQMERINQSVSSPYSYDGINKLYGSEDLNQARTKTEEALFSRLNPQFAKDEEALRTRLLNQGIGQNSEAYNREFDRFNQSKNDARMQAVLAGGTESDRLFNQSLQSRNQGIKEYDTQRNAPLNEYIGLTSGTQVQNPQFSSSNYQGSAPVDYAGMINQNYQNQMGQYNAKVGSNNATQSSVLGLGGSLLGAAGSAGGFGPLFAGFLSDINAKENIVKIGETPAGLGVYEYNYIGHVSRETGVMAQEVEKLIPAAVYMKDGFKHVNYALVR